MGRVCKGLILVSACETCIGRQNFLKLSLLRLKTFSISWIQSGPLVYRLTLEKMNHRPGFLEFNHGVGDDSHGMVASLYRVDQLELSFAVELSLSISELGVKDSKLSPSVVITGTEANQDQPCLVLENFVSKKKLLETEQFSNGTISIQCELCLYYSKQEVVKNKEGEEFRSLEDRILTFGPVEELHYIKLQQKVPFLEKLIKTTRTMFEDFTRNMEKDNNLDCLISLHL